MVTCCILLVSMLTTVDGLNPVEEAPITELSELELDSEGPFVPAGTMPIHNGKCLCKCGVYLESRS